MNVTIRLAGALALATLLVACGNGSGSEHTAAEPAVMRTYAVPAAQTEAIGMALNEVFAVGAKGHRIGRASHEVPGQLLVLAPESVQASVAESIAGLSGASVSGLSPNTVKLRLWIVDGRRGAIESGDAPAALAPAIEAISANFPGLGFHIVDQAEIAVSDGGHHSLLVTGAGNEFTANLAGADPMTFNVGISGTGNELSEGLRVRSTLKLPPGELVVMASLQQRESPAADGPVQMQFLILQAVAPTP